MTSYPNHPRLRKGAIVGVELANPLASVIVFQYNPSSLTRTLTPRSEHDDITSRQASKYPVPPRESITLELVLDATDQLEQGDPIAGTMGIYPQLAALEMLLYPKSLEILSNQIMALAGIIELMPGGESLTLFIWGPERVVPVKLTSYRVTEEYFDTGLNPIQARVNLGLTVLTYADLGGFTHPGSWVYLAHQVAKEAFAVVGSARGLANFHKVL